MSNELSTTVAITEPTLAVFIKAVTEKYPEDARAAGVVFSWIEEKQQWYVAVNRYTDKIGGTTNKQHICHAYGNSLEEATRDCIRIWKRKAGLITEDNISKLKEMTI